MTDVHGFGSLDELLPRVPLFSDMKPKMMAALAGELQFGQTPATTVMLRQGEFTEDLYVLLKGIATAYYTDPSGEVENLGSFGVHDWFGEMTALSNQPQYATVIAETPSTWIGINAPLFKKLYTGGGSFKKLIDEQYRERALAIHLRTAPLFKGVQRQALKQIASRTELQTFAAGKAIAKAGDEANAVYLVRSGVVKEVLSTPEGQRVVAYHCDNASFGEQTLAPDRILQHSFIAMGRVDVVVVPDHVIQGLQRTDSRTHTQILSTALMLLNVAETTIQPLLDPAKVTETALIDLMVGKKAVKGGEALVIDMEKCTRCNACVEACVSVHEDRVPRLSKQGLRLGNLTLASACYNCDMPECMLGCNYGAIRRDLNGAIHFLEENCTGCTACERKCPFGVIRMTALADPETEERESRSFFGRFFSRPSRHKQNGKQKKEEIKAIKCDLCAGLPFEACVYNCPCGAISRVSPEALVG